MDRENDLVGGDWTDERSRIVAAQAAAAERAAAKEAAQAQVLIDAFVAEAARRGIEPHPLLAPGKDLRRRRYRTGLVGWYLSRDERVAVDTDGRYYVLRAQGTLRERLTGAQVEPMDPPLVVGRGARDGESIDLQRLLNRRLGDPE
ncbi:hypothetical protein [Aquipuribacter hungaricus]|uniref:HK97 gp10 family phage protein n=1 Tax=Aquipuribacter hungaricus TaxID=545624 RepID=A0ABV7WBI7_9MICO